MIMTILPISWYVLHTYNHLWLWCFWGILSASYWTTWSDIRFEMSVSWYTSFIGEIDSVLTSNHQLDSLKKNGNCTPITYISRQSVRDCKPPLCNTDRIWILDPDHNPDHVQNLLDCFLARDTPLIKVSCMLTPSLLCKQTCWRTYKQVKATKT